MMLWKFNIWEEKNHAMNNNLISKSYNDDDGGIIIHNQKVC